MFKQLQNNDLGNLEVTLDGCKILVPQGTSVAAVVLAQGLRSTRTTPISNSPRAPFCMMGVCYDCLMIIDGKANQHSCATYVKQGMHVETQQGVGPALGDAR
ncbi:D-hydroxyproline dehydrogenase subunit gamma [Bathymodiolus japonicus methanotrophic gill symbiont]|uniref:(2Fe-2S)-binding protein n=1 Tax=Bathymodiolus japonicus methanotrophic gill symbiont TaxID=113269 RepID=UPI001B645E08|nr:(2Fe-2S)-binding protein [Bathymodiolus japonicus methanotrophic gill symbiont]GFO71818.1 D-hydroxyproline dehydrogenase subunit gamma [Bathymodiolus japonicus methanotrophic gill symbiont]